jgi:hypothetical protein
MFAPLPLLVGSALYEQEVEGSLQYRHGVGLIIPPR